MRRTATNPWIVLVLICLAQFMVVLDATIVNVALPSIQTSLHLSDAGLQWIVNAYTLVFGGFLLLGGRLGDLLGRKRLFLVGLVIFTGASLLDGLAVNDGMLVGARALQGLGAALISPAALSIISTTFDEGAERARALAVWAAIAIGGSAVGLILGGALTQYLSWPWIFFVNVPVGIAAFLLSLRFVPESLDVHAHRSYDIAGAATVTGGLMTLVYALVGAQSAGWTSRANRRLLHGCGRAAERLRRHRVAGEGAARPPVHLPRSLTADGERGDVPRDVGHVRDVLLQHAVHPAGAGIRPARGGACVPALHRRDHDLGVARVAVRAAHRRAAGRSRRLPAGRRRAGAADPAARPRLLRRERAARRSCCPRSAWAPSSCRSP